MNYQIVFSHLWWLSHIGGGSLCNAVLWGGLSKSPLLIKQWEGAFPSKHKGKTLLYLAVDTL